MKQPEYLVFKNWAQPDFVLDGVFDSRKSLVKHLNSLPDDEASQRTVFKATQLDVVAKTRTKFSVG
jgi:hypothetical protein